MRKGSFRSAIRFHVQRHLDIIVVSISLPLRDFTLYLNLTVFSTVVDNLVASRDSCFLNNNLILP